MENKTQITYHGKKGSRLVGPEFEHTSLGGLVKTQNARLLPQVLMQEVWDGI